VKENTLSDPPLVTNKDCEEFIKIRGRGWVCKVNNQIIGFLIVDLRDYNVSALFLLQSYEGQRISRKLHDVMVVWYFKKTKKSIWLGTSQNTRAEEFYRKAGWTKVGTHGKDEIKFEMTFANWILREQTI